MCIHNTIDNKINKIDRRKIHKLTSGRDLVPFIKEGKIDILLVVALESI
jgi:hypothetical protein